MGMASVTKTDTIVQIKEENSVEETAVSKTEKNSQKEADTEKVEDQEMKKEDIKVKDNAKIKTETDATVQLQEDKPIKETEDPKSDESKQEETKTKEVNGRETEEEEVKNYVEVNGKVVSKELLDKIKSQVEYYFGDLNLQRDKFLLRERKVDNGWIHMTVMLKFRLLASMSRDTEVLLKSLEDSELIEISEDRKKIRRSPDYPQPVYGIAEKRSQFERTIYVKGFPLVGTHLLELKIFFSDYEPIETIVMRKYVLNKHLNLAVSGNHHFKGSIFVIFKTLSGAKAFMARESVKYGDTELIRKWGESYVAERARATGNLPLWLRSLKLSI